MRSSTSTLSVASQLSHTTDGRREHPAGADGDAKKWWLLATAAPRATETSTTTERHERPGGGHAQLHPRAGHRAGAGDAPERPQLDAHHGDAAAARHERVAELVQDHRGEEREHDRDRHQVRGGGRAAEHFVEVGGERGGEVDEDHAEDHETS